MSAMSRPPAPSAVRLAAGALKLKPGPEHLGDEGNVARVLRVVPYARQGHQGEVLAHQVPGAVQRLIDVGAVLESVELEDGHLDRHDRRLVDETRGAVANALQFGLARYLAGTPLEAQLELVPTGDVETSAAEPEDDP